MSAAETLKTVPIFSELDDREIERVAATMRERRFKAGELLTEEGTGGVGFFIIEEGEAEVTVGGESKRTIGPGDYFGEIALLKDSPRTATITATSDVLCYAMTAWEFRPLVEDHSTIAWKMLSTMADRLS